MDTYTLSIGPLQVTIHELSQRHLWRLLALPSDLKAPALPEGYTHAQAVENVPDYAEAYQTYNTGMWFEQATHAFGAARLLALQTEQGKRENEAIYRYCTLYTLDYPEETLPAKRIGDLIWALADEMMAGNGTGADVIVEGYYWLSQKAGGVDQALIDEAIKSLRSNRRRDAARDSIQDRQGDSQAGEAGSGNQSKPVVRSGKRSKKLGSRPAEVQPAR